MNSADKPIISVKEARKILGKDANSMTDDQILEVINTLDLLAKDALQLAKLKLRRKKDAADLANLAYDMYQEEKAKDNKKS